MNVKSKQYSGRPRSSFMATGSLPQCWLQESSPRHICLANVRNLDMGTVRVGDGFGLGNRGKRRS